MTLEERAREYFGTDRRYWTEELAIEFARAELLRAAGIADEWGDSESCDSHDDDPCCHVRTGAAIAVKIRTLAE